MPSFSGFDGTISTSYNYIHQSTSNLIVGKEGYRACVLSFCVPRVSLSNPNGMYTVAAVFVNVCMIQPFVLLTLLPLHYLLTTVCRFHADSLLYAYSQCIQRKGLHHLVQGSMVKIFI